MEHLVHIALPTPVDQSFSYQSPEELAEGCRVIVPFGRQKLIGFTVSAPYGDQPSEAIKLKNIIEIVDDTPIFNPNLIKLARWVSQYYMHPLGEVLSAMLPASRRQSKSLVYSLSPAGRSAMGDQKSLDSAILTYIFANKSQLSQVTFEKRWEKFFEINAHEDPQAINRKKFARAWLEQSKETAITTRRSLKSQGPSESQQLPHAGAEAPWPLTAAQRGVFDALKAAFEGPESKPQLLHGITGAGKTEIYLQLIAGIFADGGLAVPSRQVLVLVPEISLTPQMTSVFERRFPGAVSVVHSALSDERRWRQLDDIRGGRTRILIGPRSAVFAGFAGLAAIIVDEEHDQSYKQASSPAYNGRDVAIVRASIEKIPVLLGSATPSLESFHNALIGRYELHELSERANARPLPAVALVGTQALMHRHRSGEPRQNHETAANGRKRPKTIDKEFLTDGLISELAANFSAGRQSMVIANRRGYAAYLLDLQQGEPARCPQCSISLTLHQHNTLLLCHYCGFRLETSRFLAARDPSDFLAIGHGSQKAEDQLAVAVPGARIARLDSDLTAKPGYLDEVLGQFRNQEIDILVGTQMLAKGHDFPNVTLIVILDVDHQLRMPDFRAGEKTFQLLVQAAGRSGRGAAAGTVLLQTDMPDNPVIQAALRHDFRAFAEAELGLRSKLRFPPYEKLVAIEFSSEDVAKVQWMENFVNRWIDEIHDLKPEWVKGLQVLGPARPPLERLSGRFRRQLLASSPDLRQVRSFAGRLLQVFRHKDRHVRFKIDVDPQSLM